MGKEKKRKSSEAQNWVPGWFGNTLTVRPTALHLQTHLKERISKAAHSKQAALQSRYEKAETDRTFGM